MLAACDGSTKGKGGGGGGTSELRLESIDYARLVDVYSYRRVNAANAQRRDITNRVPVLVARDVAIDPGIESQALFDSVGEEDPNADFQFRPFDVETGHPELLILWDNTNPDEQTRFESALRRAQTGLVPVAAAYSGQNTTVQPIPVVPRDATLRLKFSREVGVDRSFFAANPAALQVLEIVDDPRTVQPQRAFRALPYRILVQGDTLLLDPSIVGGEVTAGGKTSPGLPVSADNVTANIRIAIPTQAVGGGLGIKADNVAQLNGNDRVGLPSVIRDFRTGNSRDGRIGTLVDVEKPMILADIPMGIMAIDTANRVLTLNKRGARVALRGQVPFVIGPLAVTGFPLPMGPFEVPTVAPLRAGDFVEQVVVTPAGNVRVRAEVLMNMDVSNTGPLTTNPNLGRAADGTDGGDVEIVRVKVASLTAFGADGTPVSFFASTSPLGADCHVSVHYYENVPYSSGSYAVSDAARKGEFVTFDPAPPRIDPVTRQPVPLGSRIDPLASVSLRFSEPIDFTRLDRADNLILTNKFLPDRTVSGSDIYDIVDLVAEAKAAALSMLASSPEDFQQDGTVVRLNLPMGHMHDHDAPQPESYWVHALAGDNGLADLAGNSLDIYDRRVGTDQRRAFSMNYTVDAEAPSNLIGQRVFRFASTDEDGTKPGSPDFFGQFELRDGRLFGAPVTRFGKVADFRTISGIVRGPNGECFDPGDPGAPGPNPPARPGRVGSYVTWGPLYTTPSMVQSTFPNPPPNPFQPPAAPYTYGGIGGPHNPRGHREMTTYREDDFGLGYHDADTMLIDVEQLFWCPWTNAAVRFDEFDRYTLRLGHANKRPDLRANWVSTPNGAYCGVDCGSLFSGLSTNFDDNPLNGVMVEVVKDKAYTIDPAESFTSYTENVYTPFPHFTKTFTWRDSRLVSWNMQAQVATGLGGAVDPTQATIPPQDTTTDVSSPWETDVFRTGVVMGNMVPWPMGIIPTASGFMVNDPGDFWGNRQKDHDPIALPMLCEFNLWQDDRANGSAKGVNRMHIAYVGINAHQSPNWGYYNLGPVPPPLGAPPPWNNQDSNVRPNCGGLQYPSFTVFSAGSVDAVGNETFIDPANERTARGGIILDAGATDQITGLQAVPAANDHLYWTQANFVRRVSMCTFGFFDTLRPNRHNLVLEELSVPWEGLGTTPGLPDFQAVATRRVVDVVSIMDPPLEAQPAGTSVLLEIRGAETITRSALLWDRNTENRALERNNLLNPQYACEAYRYAMGNPGSGSIGGARVPAEGLTPYVDLEHVDSIRSPITHLLPRFMNFRLVFENDINTSAPKRPSLKSLAIVYRVKVPD